LPAVERAAAGAALAHLGDPRPGVGVRSAGIPDIAWCEVEGFHISKYPVTNVQFAAFVKAGGYEDEQYWTSAGWQRKERGGWTKPEQYPAPFNLPNHPVVGISLYEAAAFCAWLSERLEQEITLPTDEQWTYAAQGDDDCTYPWGDEIDPEKANYNATGIGTTSAVGCFPAGASPYGALDMGGNVFEWTGSEDRAVLRGGAFSYDEWFVRCAARNNRGPFDRYNHIGFRVVCGVPHPSER
jgi:formylglycine-generating enzyme required for sulfatase activity